MFRFWSIILLTGILKLHVWAETPQPEAPSSKTTEMNCPSLIPSPNRIRIGDIAIEIDYKLIMMKKDLIYKPRYTNANEEFEEWLKKEYRISPEQFNDSEIQKHAKRPLDMKLVSEKREKILQEQYAEADHEFDAWLKHQYDIRLEEFNTAVNAYYNGRSRILEDYRRRFDQGEFKKAVPSSALPLCWGPQQQACGYQMKDPKTKAELIWFDHQTFNLSQGECPPGWRQK